jgi:MFS family permease
MVGIADQDAFRTAGRVEKLATGRKHGVRGLVASGGYVIGSAALASVGSLLYGSDQGMMSNLLTGQNFGAHFPEVYTNATLKGWVVAVMQLGAWMGALVNGWLAQQLSRKYSLMVACVVSGCRLSH